MIFRKEKMVERAKASDFEQMLDKLFGGYLRGFSDDSYCHDLWSALTNIDWYNFKTHQHISYSFRAAGAVVADISGKGDYLTWYCNSPYGTVSEYISLMMKKEDWIWDDTGSVCDEPGCVKHTNLMKTMPDNTLRHTCSKHEPKDGVRGDKTIIEKWKEREAE